MKKLLFHLLVLPWLSLVSTASLTAQEFVVDQSATPAETSAGQYQFVLLSGRVGQEFVPTLDGLDFVDLLFASMTPDDRDTFQVQIREGSIGGSILDISQPLTITGGSAPVLARFSFVNTVPLLAGRTYVLEVPHSGPFWGVAVGQSTYAQGRSINLGAGEWPDEHDLWFREGIVAVPEPMIWPVLGAGLVWVLRRRRS